MVNSRCGDSNSSVAGCGPDSSVFTQQNCSLIRSQRPSFCDFEEIFRCTAEGHFKGQISSKWINSAKFRAFSRPLLTKMSVFSPKSRDERGIFSGRFSPFCAHSSRGGLQILYQGEGRNSGASQRWNRRPAGGKGPLFRQKISKKCQIELQKCGKNLAPEGRNYAQISRKTGTYWTSLTIVDTKKIRSYRASETRKC